MLREKDKEFKKDKRLAELMQRLGKKAFSEYEKEFKSTPDSKDFAEEVILTDEEETDEEE